MSEAEACNIMLIEINEPLRNRIHALLSQGGYHVVSFSSEKEALSLLESSEKGSFSLIISSDDMPAMKGDEILLHAKRISPDSRRMLVTNISDVETMINAINKADIHFCMTVPFMNSDMVRQVKSACHQFQEIKKQRNLKRVTQRQNKQLFMMASDFKKQDEADLAQIKRRRDKISMLKSRISSTTERPVTDKLGFLRNVLIQKETEFSAIGFGKQFSQMQIQIQQILGSVLPGSSYAVDDISYTQTKNKSLVNSGYIEPAMNILPALLKKMISTGDLPTGDLQTIYLTVDDLLNQYLELSMSRDGVKAFARIKRKDTKILDLESVKMFLAKNHIISGLKSDQEIETWLNDATPENDPYIIAQGREPIPPVNTRIQYHFPIEYRQAGKLRPDGSLDFTDRGKIPFVEKDVLLAEKHPTKPGIAGMTVSGDEIQVPAPEDLLFGSGSGTRFSEDGMKIYADTNGQPHLDALGNVSVHQELEIKGDVGFETGNIEFEGNLIVKGTVNEGFHVKAASLTAHQVRGAQITLTGDLNVSTGIIDAKLVKVRGNIQARYINNSKIDSFGDLTVQKEIIDSTIRLGGACKNSTGTIISSKVFAKMGIEAGNIGTPVSEPSSLTVGVDAYMNSLVAEIDSKQKHNFEVIAGLQKEMEDLEKENHGLHGVISQHAYIQDRSQLELKNVQEQILALKASGDIQAYHRMSQNARGLEEKVRASEEKINKSFERQDAIAVEISRKKDRIQQIEMENHILETEKNGLKEIADKKDPVPELKVTKKIMQGTRIGGTDSFLIVRDTLSRCKIIEVKRQGDDLYFHEMKVIHDN